jgi:hypothetical protein
MSTAGWLVLEDTFFWATMIGAALQVWSSARMAATTLGCNSGSGEYCWQHGKIYFLTYIDSLEI